MHDDVVTGRSEFLLFKDFLELQMNVYIYIYIFLGGSKFLQTAVYIFTALVLRLSTFIVDEVFSLFAVSYIYEFSSFIQSSPYSSCHSWSLLFMGQWKDR